MDVDSYTPRDDDLRMTTTPTDSVTTLAQRVAAEIRAEMARQMITQSGLARRLGVIDMWLSRRLRGQQALDLDELERICGALGLTVSQVIARSSQLTPQSTVAGLVAVSGAERRPVRLTPSMPIAA